MLNKIQYRIIKSISPGARNSCDNSSYDGKSKLAVLLGKEFFNQIAGKVVVDFGCGEGSEAVEMATKGARRVIGVDIREAALQTARQRAIDAGVQETCLFASSVDELADVVVSLDAFEHFSDPAAILRIMDKLLKPEGEVYVSFGPPWYHPLGGHLFSIFPWSHLVFSEKALIDWRSTFKTDGATCFDEVDGGLNQMTIARFKRVVADSPLQFAELDPIPIQKLRRLHNRLTLEFTTATVRCRLVKRP